MWSYERHDRITYIVNHSRSDSGGVITKLARTKWHAESYDTGETATCPTLTKAYFWVQHQAEIAARAA